MCYAKAKAASVSVWVVNGVRLRSPSCSAFHRAIHCICSFVHLTKHIHTKSLLRRNTELDVKQHSMTKRQASHWKSLAGSRLEIPAWASVLILVFLPRGARPGPHALISGWSQDPLPTRLVPSQLPTAITPSGLVAVNTLSCRHPNK